MKQGIILVLIVAVVGVGYLFSSQQNNKSNSVMPTSSQNTQQSNGSTSSKTTEMTSITMNELKNHATNKDCWTAVEGVVYDLTSFIALGQHPAEIVNACGTDGTKLFQTRGDKNSPHPQSASMKLETMIVGKLEK